MSKDPVIEAATAAVERTLSRRKTNIFDDYQGTMRAVVKAAANAAAVKGREGMVALDDVEAILRERDQLLEPEEVNGLMRAMYGAAGVDPDDLPEHLQLPDDAG